MTTRSLPPWLAPVVEQLELDRPALLRTRDVAALAASVDVDVPEHLIVKNLAERGWLLPTGVRGVWEFAPAERAGPYSQGDPFIVLRGALLAHPEFPAAVSLGSAMWRHNLYSRPPHPHEVTLPPGAKPLSALRRAYRITHLSTRIDPMTIDGVPTHRPETVLTHLVEKPGDVRSWGSVLDVLAELVDRCDRTLLHRELAGRSHATRARLAYLTSGVAPDLADSLKVDAAGVVWFGPRRSTRRRAKRWNVVDTVLPVDPATLEA